MAENMNAVELDMLDILSAAANSDDVETMEREGVVGPSEGARPREVYVSPIEIE